MYTRTQKASKEQGYIRDLGMKYGEDAEKRKITGKRENIMK